MRLLSLAALLLTSAAAADRPDPRAEAVDRLLAPLRAPDAPLNLPHDWSIEGPYAATNAAGTGYLPGGIGWYRKSFRPAAADRPAPLLHRFRRRLRNRPRP